MRWSFIVDITEVKGTEIRKLVEMNAKEMVKPSAIGKLEDKEQVTFRLVITYFQKKERYIKGKPQIPREDRGDIDNIIKRVCDGLGPIIGYRQDWKKRNTRDALDASITEVIGKKVNSGSDKEYLSIEIENIIS